MCAVCSQKVLTAQGKSMLWCASKNNNRKGSFSNIYVVELILPSEIAEESHIEFLVWARKIAMRIGLTPSLFWGTCLETENAVCGKKWKYGGSVK